jgi:hypothetical protein
MGVFQKAETASLIDALLNNGYLKEGYGYKKVTENNTHWVSLFEDCLQMYAYFTEDEELDKVYDTGNVKVSEAELHILIKVFNHNHK